MRCENCPINLEKIQAVYAQKVSENVGNAALNLANIFLEEGVCEGVRIHEAPTGTENWCANENAGNIFDTFYRTTKVGLVDRLASETV